MSTFEFLQELQQQDITLYREEDKLKVNAPKGAMTADLAAQIKTRKADILAFLEEVARTEAGGLNTAVSAPPIQPAPRIPPLPLTFGQERLWRLHQMSTNPNFYNIPYLARLRGPLHTAALQQALQFLLKRHEALRTSFAPAGDNQETGARHTAVSIIHDPASLNVALTISPTAASEEQARDMLDDLIHQPFDLSQAPLIRAGVVPLSPNEHLFGFAVHHIVFDGWSAALLRQELTTAYAHFAQEKTGEPFLPPLLLHMADYAQWQRQWLTDDTLTQKLAYWRTQLARQPTPLQLPTDQPLNNTAVGNAGQTHPIHLPASLITQLKTIGQQTQTSLFLPLLAAFNTLLYRYSGQTDLLVGTPIAGRQQRELESIIGYFNNIVVLRSDLTDNPTFHDLLTRLRPMLLGAMDHQDVPFQMIAELPAVVRVPLTRALFALDTTEEPLTLAGLAAEKVPLDQRTADFDLAFYLNEQPRGDLRALILYKSDLFSAPAISQLADNFVALLTAVGKNPHQPLDTLPLAHTPTPTSQKVTLTADAPPPTASPAPRNDTEKLLLGIWQEVLQTKKIGIHDNFFALGGHSLLALRLFEKITLATGQNLPLATLLGAPTIAELTAVLTTADQPPSWSSLVPIQPHGDLPPLFFIHAHGGNVVGYYDLGRYLGKNQPLYGLQAHGLSGDVPLLTDFNEMAAHYVNEMRQLQPHGPYYVGGWCLGGYLSFAVAHELQKQGEEAAFVGIFEAPHPEYDAVAVRASGLTRILTRAVRRSLDRLDTETMRVTEVPSGERLSYLTNRTHRLLTNLQTKAVRQVGTERVDPTVQAVALAKIEVMHEEALQAYEWRLYHGRVTIFRAEKQPRGRPDDPTLGWHNWVTGEIEVQNIPGTRIGMLEEPRVSISAQRIAESLARAREASEN